MQQFALEVRYNGGRYYASGEVGTPEYDAAVAMRDGWSQQPSNNYCTLNGVDVLVRDITAVTVTVGAEVTA